MRSLRYLSQSHTILARNFFASVDVRVSVYRRFLFANLDLVKVILQSICHKVRHFFFVSFSYNRKLTDVALSFRSADKITYQSKEEKPLWLYLCAENWFVSRDRTRCAKLRAGDVGGLNIKLRNVTWVYSGRYNRNWHSALAFFKRGYWHV